MALNPIDHTNFLNDLLLSQYKNSPNFNSLFNDFGTITNDIESQIQNILNSLDFQSPNVGNQLDLVGSLVGLPRMEVKIPVNNIWILNQTPFTNHLFGDKGYSRFKLASDDVYRDALTVFINNHFKFCDLVTLYESLSILLNPSLTLRITLNSSLNVSVHTTGQVDVGRLYLFQEYIAPNGSPIWPKCMGCTYTYTNNPN